MAIPTPDKAKNISEPKEQIENAPTILKSPEAVEAELAKIEEGVESADANVAAAIEKVQKLENEDAFTPAEMAKLAEISERRKESISGFAKFMTSAKERLFGKKEEQKLAPESPEAIELESATNTELAAYAERFNAGNDSLIKGGANMLDLSKHYAGAINKINTAFMNDPRGTLANILETIGAKDPDAEANKLWSVGKAGVIYNKFENILRRASRDMGRTDIKNMRMEIETKNPPLAEKKTPSEIPLIRALEASGVNMKKEQRKTESLNEIVSAASESLAGIEEEHRDPLVRLVDEWVPTMGVTDEETENQLISLMNSWDEARDAYTSNPKSAEVIKELDIILKAIGYTKEDAETVWKTGIAGAIIGHAEKRFAEMFRRVAQKYPMLEVHRMARKAGVKERVIDVLGGDIITPKEEKEEKQEKERMDMELGKTRPFQRVDEEKNGGDILRTAAEKVIKKPAKKEKPPDELTA